MREWDPRHRLVLSLDGADEIASASAPECASRESSTQIEVYRPKAEGPRPAVIFVHGDAAPEVLRGITQWGQYVSWGQAVAVSGIVGVTFEHSSSEGLTQIERVLDEIDAILDCIRVNADGLGIDSDRLCLWSCSAGVPFGVSAAIRSPSGIRCLVAYYGWLDLRPMRSELTAEVSGMALAAASPLAYLESGATIPPLLVVKAGRDQASINISIDAFMSEAGRSRAPVDLLVHTSGRHAFDVLDDVDESRAVIEGTISFMKNHLRS